MEVYNKPSPAYNNILRAVGNSKKSEKKED